jgi:hypothetical protein
MVLRRALILIAIGFAIGIAGALSLTHLMSALLYEVRPTDAGAYLGAFGDAGIFRYSGEPDSSVARHTP